MYVVSSACTKCTLPSLDVFGSEFIHDENARWAFGKAFAVSVQRRRPKPVPDRLPVGR